jgi:hypothetical protein
VSATAGAGSAGSSRVPLRKRYGPQAASRARAVRRRRIREYMEAFILVPQAHGVFSS